MACRRSVVQTPLYRITLSCAPLCIVVFILGITCREARHRGSRKRRIIVPALKVITRARCRSQGDIRIQYGITRNRVRIGRRVSRRGTVIQRICNRIRVCRTPLCIVVLCLRIHGREAGNRRPREGSIVVPAFKGIAVSTCRQEVDVAAAVGEHCIAREVRSRIGRRVPRRASVVQCIYNRIGNRRAAPLCIILFVLGIHGVQARNRCSRETRIVIPAEEAIAGTRCRMDGDIRIFDRVIRNRVRIGRRMSRRGGVIQVPLNRIVLCRAPLRIEMLICRIADRETRDRGTRECRVLVPAFKVVTGARCRSQRDIRIEHGITHDRVRIHRRVTGRCAVIQGIYNRIAVCRTPLCIVLLVLGIHGADARHRRTC